MNKDRIKGAAKQAKGAIKDAAGKVTGDVKLQAEGKGIRHWRHVAVLAMPMHLRPPSEPPDPRGLLWVLFALTLILVGLLSAHFLWGEMAFSPAP